MKRNVLMGGKNSGAVMIEGLGLYVPMSQARSLQAEVQRLCTANIDSVAVCEQALQAKTAAEQERDQLKAYQVELVRELTSCQSVLHMLAHAGEVTPAYADDAKAVLKRKSEHSLAQHDAQVIKQFVRDYTDWQGIDWMLTDFMHKRVDELSQKAKEVQS